MLAGGWWAGGRSGIHYGWGGGSTTSYSTNNYSLKAAGIKDINNEEAQEYGLQLGAEEDGSIIGSTEYVLGGGGSGWIGWEWE